MNRYTKLCLYKWNINWQVTMTNNILLWFLRIHRTQIHLTLSLTFCIVYNMIKNLTLNVLEKHSFFDLDVANIGTCLLSLPWYSLDVYYLANTNSIYALYRIYIRSLVTARIELWSSALKEYKP